MNLPIDSESRARNHLFISYATEDWVLADWLALKLASEGYNVWYDRIKMLGGESYPYDITEAIQHRTYRVIALLSRNSTLKPNPVKERTLAINVGKKLGIKDFLIPLNVDGLGSEELEFLVSDLVYISFHRSWYDGLSNLIEKLDKISTPKNVKTNQDAVSQWLFSEEQPTTKNETIWSNLVPILEFPSKLLRYKIHPETELKSNNSDWLSFLEDDGSFLAFKQPNDIPSQLILEVEEIDYLPNEGIYDNYLMHVFRTLLYEALRNKCIQKGLTCDPSTKRLYFPPDLLPNDKLYLIRFDGRKTWFNVVGERKFRLVSQGNSITEYSRYHLSPSFRFLHDYLGDPVIRLRISVFWTDLRGNPLDAKTANRRRKKMCKNWWNYHWLSRVTGIMQWLGEGEDEITLIDSDFGKLRIGMKPVTFTSEFGISEEELTISEEEEPDTVIEDTDEEGEKEDDESE